MKDLPSLYARVVAKRPELAVVHEGRTLYHFPGLEGWGLQHPRTKTIAVLAEYREFNDICAAALILARWVEALTVGQHVSHDANEDGDKTWCVYELQADGVRFISGPRRMTPLEALAAFYLGDSQ